MGAQQSTAHVSCSRYFAPLAESCPWARAPLLSDDQLDGRTDGRGCALTEGALSSPMGTRQSLCQMEALAPCLFVEEGEESFFHKIGLKYRAVFKEMNHALSST